MSVPAHVITPEALDEARRLYERSNVPVQQIADMLGISKSTLNTRIRGWGWTRRAGRIPPPDADPAPAPAPTEAAPPLVPAIPTAGGALRGNLITRLVARIESEIGAVERIVARAGLAANGVTQAERAARTLAILVRSLRELAALARQEPEEEDEDAGRDTDAFRRELGATLERVLAGGKAP
ncbi:hypothetical protein AncyloWKF20_00650 [Ancylobacter sp. WKF20]|uniref:hypothetical protein n=1 Tax=Ancylobacter sp. WKF20 TaxID=3039801 RepID=UPI0024344639|nr:hypothetical protein [Ancylobacter sp. WKF20]WGD30384.1 hypothetical protein AncyloWKF20_00650 [Ancylobacter sp. WKF20]